MKHAELLLVRADLDARRTKSTGVTHAGAKPRAMPPNAYYEKHPDHREVEG